MRFRNGRFRDHDGTFEVRVTEWAFDDFALNGKEQSSIERFMNKKSAEGYDLDQTTVNENRICILMCRTKWTPKEELEE